MPKKPARQRPRPDPMSLDASVQYGRERAGPRVAERPRPRLESDPNDPRILSTAQGNEQNRQAIMGLAMLLGGGLPGAASGGAEAGLGAGEGAFGGLPTDAYAGIGEVGPMRAALPRGGAAPLGGGSDLFSGPYTDPTLPAVHGQPWEAGDVLPADRAIPGDDAYWNQITAGIGPRGPQDALFGTRMASPGQMGVDFGSGLSPADLRSPTSIGDTLGGVTTPGTTPQLRGMQPGAPPALRGTTTPGLRSPSLLRGADLMADPTNPGLTQPGAPQSNPLINRMPTVLPRGPQDAAFGTRMAPPGQMGVDLGGGLPQGAMQDATQISSTSPGIPRPFGGPVRRAPPPPPPQPPLTPEMMMADPTNPGVASPWPGPVSAPAPPSIFGGARGLDLLRAAGAGAGIGVPAGLMAAAARGGPAPSFSPSPAAAAGDPASDDDVLRALGHILTIGAIRPAPEEAPPRRPLSAPRRTASSPPADPDRMAALDLGAQGYGGPPIGRDLTAADLDAQAYKMAPFEPGAARTSSAESDDQHWGKPSAERVELGKSRSKPRLGQQDETIDDRGLPDGSSIFDYGTRGPGRPRGLRP